MKSQRKSLYGPQIVRDVLSLIHNCIGLGGAHWYALSNALDLSPTDSQETYRHLHISLKATDWYVSMQAADTFRAGQLSFERAIFTHSPPLACAMLSAIQKVTLSGTDPLLMQAFFRSSRTQALRCLELLNIPYFHSYSPCSRRSHIRSH